jgi:DNA-binding transcriptional ArsR family regulator
MTRSRVTPGPESLRALAHPVRLRMLGLLRSEGPATATSLATRLGLNTGATSYHLRQLARHGYIEDDVDGTHGGSGRERWWRAAHRSTEFGGPASSRDDAARDAVGAFLQAVAVVQVEQVQRAVEERDLLPDRWREVSTLADWEVRLTPARARTLLASMATLVDEAEDEPVNTDDSAAVVVQVAMFPRPGTVAIDGDADGVVDQTIDSRDG